MPELVGLIAAAGKGTRAYPDTRKIPKGMLKVGGIPIIEHLVRIQRDDMGVRRIYIVVGTLSEYIEEYFGDGSSFGVQIEYLRNDQVHRGLAYSVALGSRKIDGPFVLMLSDEYYQDTKHERLAGMEMDGLLGYCSLIRTDDWNSISRNYTVRLDDDMVTRLLEKPREREGDMLGTGTFLLSPKVFGLLDEALAASGGDVDFVGVLDGAVRRGYRMSPFFLGGSYVNVNDVDSLNRANSLSRVRQLSSEQVLNAIRVE